jgi:hypothetical protein
MRGHIQNPTASVRQKCWRCILNRRELGPIAWLGLVALNQKSILAGHFDDLFGNSTVTFCIESQRINFFIGHPFMFKVECKGKAVPLQAWSGPEGSRKLRFPDHMTTAQDGGKVVSIKHRPPLPPGNAPGTHLCYRLSRPQGHSEIGRIMSMKNSNDTIWNHTSDLPIRSTVP